LIRSCRTSAVVYMITLMTKSSPFAIAAILMSLLWFGLTASVSAQVNPTMPSQANDSLKDRLFAEFNDLRKSLNPDQRRFAYPAARDYLRKFGGDNDSNAKEVQKFVTEYERALHNGDIFAAYEAKNYAKAFELGRPHLKTDPDDFFVLGTLTEAGYDSAVAGNATLNEETIGYARRAIRILEAGKLTRPDPFKSLDMARGYLNSTLGWFVKDQAPVEAAAAFLKAAQSDSPFRNDPAVYHRMGGALLKGEFAQLSAEYNQKFGAQLASPEQKAMLDRIMHTADRAIDAYARAVALMDRPEQQEARTKILAQLTALYKNFHNDSVTGLNELIATVLSKPMP
jgi:tetratricopeptide (TPR) repeat protein